MRPLTSRNGIAKGRDQGCTTRHGGHPLDPCLYAYEQGSRHGWQGGHEIPFPPVQEVGPCCPRHDTYPPLSFATADRELGPVSSTFSLTYLRAYLYTSYRETSILPIYGYVPSKSLPFLLPLFLLPRASSSRRPRYSCARDRSKWTSSVFPQEAILVAMRCSSTAYEAMISKQHCRILSPRCPIRP